MYYDLEIKTQAVNLRKKGHSINEISDQLHISKSTASLWLRSTFLSPSALLRLQDRRLAGREKAKKILLNKSRNKDKTAKDQALKTLSNVSTTKETSKLVCSLLFWAEGSKVTGKVVFTNSDSNMIRVFLKLLRLSFDLDEKKFRALIHLHEYHDESFALKYWSKITSIPLVQFNKSYLKPHTSINKKKGYMGTISIRYYDGTIARELHSIYNTFVDHLGL